MSYRQLDMLKPSILGRLSGESWLLHFNEGNLFVTGASGNKVQVPLSEQSTCIISSKFGYKLSFYVEGAKHCIDFIQEKYARLIRDLIENSAIAREKADVQSKAAMFLSQWEEIKARNFPESGYVPRKAFDQAQRELLNALSGDFKNLKASVSDANKGLLASKAFNQITAVIENGTDYLNGLNEKRLTKEFQRYRNLFEKAGLNLTHEQAMAALAMEQANILEAGAGSGKTVVIVARVLYAVASQKFLPSEIVCIAFNNNATKEINERLTKAFLAAELEGANDILVTTFHALGLSLIRYGSNDSVKVISDSSCEPKRLFAEAAESVLSDTLYAEIAKRFEKDLIAERIIDQNESQELICQAVLQHLQAAELRYFASRYKYHGVSPEADLKCPSNPWRISPERYENLHGIHSLIEKLSATYRALMLNEGLTDYAGMTVNGSGVLCSLKQEQGAIPRKLKDIADRKFILVDEFQDIAFDRAILVKALASLNEDSVVFGVGDDWQSINRFAGSDINLFTEFENLFGTTDRRQLTATFRSCRGIAESARRFVIRNPAQSQKVIERVFDERIDGSILSIPYEDQNDSTIKIQKCINHWVEDSKTVPKIMILGRTQLKGSRHFKAEDLSQIKEMFQGKADITYQTAHGSKGLEADYVIIVGLADGVFPSHRVQDYWMDLYLPREDKDIAYADDRRLFYVAITRAKKATALMTYRPKPSRFVSELMNIFNQL